MINKLKEKTYSLDSPIQPSTYSVSRLKTLMKCTQYFKLKYVDRIKVEDISPATLLGNICHSALEFYYTANPKIDKLTAFEQGLRFTLLEKKLLPEEHLEMVWEKLWSYIVNLNVLFTRARPDYEGDDAIRTGKGTLAKNPMMTTQWKQSFQNMGLDNSRTILDLYLSHIEGVSVCDICVEAFSIINNYRHPRLDLPDGTQRKLKKILHIELPISDIDRENGIILNPVKMPDQYGGDKEIYINQYIDLIGADEDDNIVLLDHKSSKQEFTHQDILYNVQLLSYVWAYEQLHDNLKVKYIGINNLRFGNCKIVEVPDRELLNERLETLFNKHLIIEQELFSKITPEPYSPCLNSYSKKCPYLGICWPGVLQ